MTKLILTANLLLLSGNWVRECEQRQRKVDEGVVVLLNIRLSVDEL